MEILYTSDRVPDSSFFLQLRQIFPCLDQQVINPVTNELDYLHNVVVELNDDHGWTRHQIADWIETLSLDISRSDKYEHIDSTRVWSDD